MPRDPDYIRDQLPRTWLLAWLYFRADVQLRINDADRSDLSAVDDPSRHAHRFSVGRN